MKPLFTCIIFIAFSFSLFAQYPIEKHQLNNPTFLDSTISNYSIVFTAEVHGSKINCDREKKVITYLASKNRINTIVLEGSYIYSYWLNQFLQNGDTLFLRELTSFYSVYDDQGDDVKYEDSYTYYLWLYQFIHTNDLDINIIGIDLEFISKPEPILWSFIQLTSNIKELKKLKESINNAKKISSEDKVTKYQFKKWFYHLEKEVNENGINNKILSLFITNIKQAIPFSGLREYQYREKIMYHNFLSMIHKNDKVFGQFGLSHIMLKDRQMSKNRLATYLNQNELFKDKILSIGLVCYNCQAINLPKYDEYLPFLTKEEFERLTPKFKKLPTNTFVDLRSTDEIIKEYSQLLLIVHNNN